MEAEHRRFIDSDGCDVCPRSLSAADAVLGAGYRRVSEDDDTVERVARGLCVFDGYIWPDDDCAVEVEAVRMGWTVARPGYYLDRARAALAALRGGTDG
jgi:hypothetical protein